MVRSKQYIHELKPSEAIERLEAGKGVSYSEQGVAFSLSFDQATDALLFFRYALSLLRFVGFASFFHGGYGYSQFYLLHGASNVAVKLSLDQNLVLCHHVSLYRAKHDRYGQVKRRDPTKPNSI